MKWVHVLGGGLWQLPTIRRAKELGYRVLITDMYAERPGYALADAHEVVDICDHDATLNVARKYRVDGIICDTTDVGVPTAAYVAEKMGLPGIGHDVALRFTNKYEMRQATTAAGLQQMRFTRITSARELVRAAADVGYPLVIKPVDSQSSRGVHVVKRPAELVQHFEDALRCSRQRAVLVEEFLRGVEVTVEGMCFGHKYATVGISDKSHYQDRPEVAKRLTYPAAFAPSVLDKIRRTNNEIVQALGLRQGVTHAEYMVDGDKVQLVEIAARGGGSRIYSHIMPHLTDTDVVGHYLRFVMGEQPCVPYRHLERAASLEFLDLPAGKVETIMGQVEAAQVPGIAELHMDFAVGDQLHRPGDDRSRPGFMLVLGTTRAEVLERSRCVHDLLQIKVAAA